MSIERIVVSGARAESLPDTLRRTGLAGVLPTDNDVEALTKYADAVAANAGLQAAVDAAQMYAAQAQAAIPYYATKAAGAAATSAPYTFLSDEDGPMRVYDEAGNLLYGVVTGDDVPLTPEMFGAVGDGVTIDTDALLAMIAFGGVGSRFSGQSGSVYVYDGELFPAARQSFKGFRFKRADQAVTTLTAAMTDTATGAGATLAISVADTAGFRVGSYITITKASPTPGASDNTDIVRHRIAAKSVASGPGTLTIYGGFTLTFAIGAEVVSAYHLFANTADNVTWTDIEIDGNRANWQNKGLRWETINEIRTAGDNCHVDRLWMTDCPGEGVQLGGKGSTCTNWSAYNMGGNPVHLSGGEGLVVDGFYVEGANRVWFETDEAYTSGRPVVPGTMGHEDGGVAFSLDCQHAKISNGVVRDALSGFSPPNNPTADHASVSKVTVIDCATPFKLSQYNSLALNCTISDCQFIDSGLGVIGRTLAGATEAQSQLRTTLRDCHFSGTRVELENCYYVDILGGSFYYDTGDIPSGLGVIGIANVKHCRISTVIDGADYGVLVQGTSEFIDVSGSRIRRAITAGVSLSNCDAGMKGNRVIGCEIEATAVISGASFRGIIMNGGDTASGNEFDFTAATAAARCISAANGSRHFQNNCRIATGVYAILAAGGSTGIVVKDNFATVYAGSWELTNSFSNGGGGSNTFTPNYELVA